MNRIYLLLFIALSFNLTRGQNNAPVVSNVIFSQRTDGSYFVDIYYDVYDPDNNYMTVKLYASNNAGSTWDFSCDSVSGDARNLVLSGTRKHIVWDFGAEHPEYFSDQICIKIIADDCINEEDGFPCPDVSTVEYEGTTYNTVKIGDQCWFKENLNVGKMIRFYEPDDIPSDDGILEKYCYDNDLRNCEIYGGLYRFEEIVSYDTTAESGDICPEGWRLPTYDELIVLAERVGMQKNALLAVGEQNGTNTSGFSALLAGGTHPEGGFIMLGYWASFVSSNIFYGKCGPDYITEGLCYWDIRFYNNTNGHNLRFGKNLTFRTNEHEYIHSVRCIQD